MVAVFDGHNDALTRPDHAHLALGSDFDGATIAAALGDAAGLPRLLAALADAGFGGEEIASIAWGNWRRVLGAWWWR